MNPTRQAVIAIRRPDDWVGRSWRTFIVRIDGRQAGKVKRGAIGEFTIEPGTHTVAVSMGWAWARSRPAQVVVEPGSRTELVIRGRTDKMACWMDSLSFAFAMLIMFAFSDMLDMLGFADANWWVRTGVSFVVYLVASTVFVLVITPWAHDYRAMWTQERVGTTAPQGPASG